VSAFEPLNFFEFVDLLRERLGYADALKPSELHSFKELMSDYAAVIPEGWYYDAFDELDAQGHLDRHVSSKANLLDAHARLSADGRLCLRNETGDA
jgi:hypothetical protein